MPRSNSTKKSPEDRFWKKVKKGDKCWIWIGAKNQLGYGRFRSGLGFVVQAHRFSYEVRFGKIPIGLFVLHKCDNPPCVNPDHLFVGTQSENIRDMVKKGRHGFKVHPERVSSGDKHWTRVNPKKLLRGEKHQNARLSDCQVREIRRKYLIGDITQEKLGKEYGVSQRVISGIVRRFSWKHI